MKTHHETDGNAILRVLLALSALAMVIALMSCAVEVREPVHEIRGGYSGELYYSEAPPLPRIEVVASVSPGPNHVWGGGYWTRHHDQWHWMDGRWEQRPHAQANWEDGRWHQDSRGYVRMPGRWHDEEKHDRE